MAGAAIDHIISLTILISALLIAMMSFNQLFSTAVAYETNTQVATKAVDIMNTICLSPGDPVDWGETNITVSGFGLQDPDSGGYTLSPYSLMRLNTALDDSQLVYYDETGVSYNNISTNTGHAILTPIGGCINYSTASELLGLTDNYGFSIDINPTLNVIVNEVTTDPWLTVNVTIEGSGMPLSEARLNYYLFTVTKIDESDYPIIGAYSGVAETDSDGSAIVEFPAVTGADPVYSFTTYVSLSGVNGVGYLTSNTLTTDEFIVPLIEDYDEGEIILAHSWDIIYPGQAAEVKFNATFYVLTSDFQLQLYDLNCSGHLNSGGGFPFVRTTIPNSEVGILVITYMKNPNQMGSIIVPWGIGALGVSASFGTELGSGNSDFVATEVRQVTVDGISYQVKVSVWKIGN